MAETIGALILAAATAGEAGAAGSGIAGLGTLATTTIAGTTVTLATVVGTAAILGVSIGLNYALRPGTPKPEDGSVALKQGVPPRIKAYGINRLAGFFMMLEAAGPAPATLYHVQAFHSGPIDSVIAFLLSDDIVGTTGDVSHGGVSTILPDFADERYSDGAIQVEIKLGRTGEGTLSSFISDPLISSIWTAAHVGNGIAHVGMKCASGDDPAKYSRVYPRGRPELSLVALCSLCWDPRDPAQLRADRTTWQFTRNPVLLLIDKLTGDREDAGMGLDLDIVLPPDKLAQWITEANLCDEQVDKDVGTEARYQADGWFTFDNGHDEVVGNILSTCDGWMGESGDGTLSLTVGVYRAPTDPPWTEEHIIGFNLPFGQTDEQLVNALDITFTDPSQKYVTTQTEPWEDADSISVSGRRAQQLDLKWVLSNSQARRLGQRALQRLNPLQSGTIITNLLGLDYLGTRWIAVQYPFVSGLQDCVIEVQDAEIDLARGRITWSFIRIAPDHIEAYSPPTDEGNPPVVPPSVIGAAYRREDGSPLLREDGSIYSREDL